MKDGTAVRSPVTVTLAGRDQVVVASGCSAGDHVIVSGQSQVTQGATVREIMTAEVVSVAEATPIEQIAALMAQKKIKRVPVARDGVLWYLRRGPRRQAHQRNRWRHDAK